MALRVNPMDNGEIIASRMRDGEHVVELDQSSTGPQKNLISQHLSLSGDGVGTVDFIGDYSSVADIAYIQPPASTIYRVARMIIYIEAGSGFRAERYGNLSGALANGIHVHVENDGGTIVDLTSGFPIKTNGAWGHACFDVDLKTWGAGDEMLLARWTFQRSGQFIRLDGDENERLEISLDDDFTGLVHHKFLIQGYVE